eukprot:SAG11_NODE_2723_length_3043_cov_5.018003_1_plen_103_part_00
MRRRAARGERSDQKRYFTIGTQTLQNTHSRKSSTDSQAVLDPGMDPICQYCSRYAVRTAVTAAASRRIGLSSISVEKLIDQATKKNQDNITKASIGVGGRVP